MKVIAQVQETELRTRKTCSANPRAAIIDDAQTWFGYYDARCQTAHSYDGATAIAIYELGAPLAWDARRLLEALRDAA